ncbi:hypothetical protein KR054_007085 [Drosophila jambulina]|nr:hypothetical protein KR054_007085 [Drosophila jambulina]
MSTTNNEASQLLQRLSGLRIVETPKDQKEVVCVARECYSLDSKKFQRVPSTPCSGGPGKFDTDLKKRRKVKRNNRIHTYEVDKHFIKARKSLNF